MVRLQLPNSFGPPLSLILGAYCCGLLMCSIHHLMWSILQSPQQRILSLSSILFHVFRVMAILPPSIFVRLLAHIYYLFICLFIRAIK